MDYYALLQLDKTATTAQIKKAFRNLSKMCHPDLFPEDPMAEEMFKEISEAYRILTDADERAYYDRTGEARPKTFDPARGEGDARRGDGIRYQRDAKHLDDRPDQVHAAQDCRRPGAYGEELHRGARVQDQDGSRPEADPGKV